MKAGVICVVSLAKYPAHENCSDTIGSDSHTIGSVNKKEIEYLASLCTRC
jgi:hypothetical protein